MAAGGDVLLQKGSAVKRISSSPAGGFPSREQPTETCGGPARRSTSADRLGKREAPRSKPRPLLGGEDRG